MKKVTMKDIASKLNLSINAVSLVLNDKAGVSEETRSLVLKTAEELGYLEQNKKYKKAYTSKNLCILIKRVYFRDMHFYSKILLGLEQEAKKNHYDILFTVLDNNEIPTCIENHKVAGIFIVGKIETEFLARVKRYNIPVILVDSTNFTEQVDSVMSDNRLGGYKATRYLIDSGFHHIGFFGDLDYTTSVRERFWGYQEALKHLPAIDSYEDITHYTQRFSVLSDIEQHILGNDIQKLSERLTSVQQIPEVFLCSNDNAAIGVINAFTTLGYHLPEEISVMGFDDIDLCNMIAPKLTTIQVNKELMGKKAIQLFMWRLLNIKAPVEKILVGIEIIERDSVVRKVFEANEE